MDNYLAFWVFIIITGLRQIYYFWHQSTHKPHRNTTKDDSFGSSLFFIFYTLIWLGSIYELYKDFAPNIYLIGLVLVLVGVIIRVNALNVLGDKYSHEITIKPQHQLVTSRVYSVVRHPLYLALLIELLGMVFVGHSLWLFIVWVFFIVVVCSRIQKEDKALLVLGEHVKQYHRSVPALNIIIGYLRKLR